MSKIANGKVSASGHNASRDRGDIRELDNSVHRIDGSLVAWLAGGAHADT